MKRLMILAGLAAATITVAAAFPPRVAGAEEVTAECKAAYLADYDSGTVVYAKNETERLPIASMCKVMTLLLSFEAVDDGALAYDEQITVSDNAAGMGGSQVFLEANCQYPVSQLMKSIVVCSANDSCVALAERIGGSESAFVDRMNERAQELGANDTLFANCTGLPKEPQYSCAKDVALMLRALLSHEKYFEFSRIWLEDFTHPDGRTTSMTNTNKLIRFYEGCDGGKTGFTNQAGFCLAATAKRGDMRLISVVIGAESSDKRFESAKNMMNYAFNAYESRKLVEAGKTCEFSVSVRGSKIKEIGVMPEHTLTTFAKKGEKTDAEVRYELKEDVKAPVQAGDCVGEAIVYVNGVESGRTNLLAASGAERYSYGDAFLEGAENWN